MRALIFKVRGFGVFLLFFALLGLFLKYQEQYMNMPIIILPEFIAFIIKDLATESLGLALGVLFIDVLYYKISNQNEQRVREQAEIKQKEELKKRLILEMGSMHNQIATNAVKQLRDKGWLLDGTLKHANLSGANLEQVNLRGAILSFSDLTDANLSFTILNHADISNANLSGANLEAASLINANFDNTILFGANMKNTTK